MEFTICFALFFVPPSIPTTEVDLATTRARLRPSPYIPLFPFRSDQQTKEKQNG